MRHTLKSVLLQSSIIRRILGKRRFSNSADYWEKRYEKGGTSGSGSYNRLADFKNRILNNFVSEMGIKTVIEWGCGDGNQLKNAKYPQYVGLDVAPKAVELCKKIFSNDSTKKFYTTQEWLLMNNSGGDFREKFDCAMSIDVIFHLVEDEVYTQYLKNLFDSSNKFVVIYSNDIEEPYVGGHERHREFSKYVSAHFPDWKLTKKVLNEYPYDPQYPDSTSFSDFYFYEKE